jgi:hypothetical protein
MLATSQHDLTERPEFPRRRVVGDHLTLEDRLPRPQPRGQARHDVGKLPRDPLQPPGEQLDLPVRGAMRLDPDAVVLVLRAALPAQLGQDLRAFGEPLRQHGPHRAARRHPQFLDRGEPVSDQDPSDSPQVAADVIGAFQYRPGGLPAGLHLGQRVQDGGRTDAQPQVPGDQAQQVAGLQRGGQGEQPAQQLQLAALRARPFRRGDLAQRGHHDRDLQAGRPPVAARGQQLLGGLPQVAHLPHQPSHLSRLCTGGGAHRAHGHLLGQPEVHPGELRRDQSLAQVAHRGQQLRRSLRQQRGQPLGQHEPPGDLLQVTVCLRHDQVPHGVPFPGRS